MKPFLSIIIPAYNEESRLPKTLHDINICMQNVAYSYEILVVSDGSRDQTVSLTRDLSKEIKNLKIIDNTENHGKGWVTRQGMLAGTGEWRLFMDADNSTTMREFEKFLPFLEKGYGVLIGSRGVHGAELHPPQPWFRKIPGKIGNLIIQILLLPGIQDTQCGFKCFSATATETIFPLMKIDRWGFDVEALALARKFKFKIKELPIRWENDIHSKVGAGAYVSTLQEVFKIRWWIWAGKYHGEK